jgi:cyclic pyranopterin phosphate synthase
VIRGFNDDEVTDLLEFSRAHGAESRFIEYMDVGGATQWSMDDVVSREQMLALIAEKYGAVEALHDGGPAPAERYRLADGLTFGIIASTTAPFCSSCDRSRVTADGTWLLCLYADDGVDLREPLRRGAPDEEIASLIRARWQARTDRGAEARLADPARGVLYQVEGLRADPRRRDAHARRMSQAVSRQPFIPSPCPLNIALIEPRIPPNTGNIARLCAAADTPLHLIGPTRLLTRREGREARGARLLGQDRSLGARELVRVPGCDQPHRCLYFSANAAQDYRKRTVQAEQRAGLRERDRRAAGADPGEAPGAVLPDPDAGDVRKPEPGERGERGAVRGLRKLDIALPEGRRGGRRGRGRERKYACTGGEEEVITTRTGRGGRTPR